MQVAINHASWAPLPKSKVIASATEAEQVSHAIEAWEAGHKDVALVWLGWGNTQIVEIWAECETVWMHWEHPELPRRSGVSKLRSPFAQYLCEWAKGGA